MNISFTVEARIEQVNSAIVSLQKNIRSQFKVALLQQSRQTRQLKVEDYYYQNQTDGSDLIIECAKVAASVTNSVTNSVKKQVKASASKKGKKTVSKKKHSTILAQGPSSTLRKSSRKRAPPGWLNDSETPLASSTLTAAALGGFSTTTRSAKPSASFLATPMIAPKFDPMTPLTRTVTRGKKSDEKFLVSMNGSPVYVGGRAGSRKNENLIPLPIGGGQTLMVPSDNPEIQPLLQSLISSCMNIMNK